MRLARMHLRKLHKRELLAFRRAAVVSRIRAIPNHSRVREVALTSRKAGSSLLPARILPDRYSSELLVDQLALVQSATDMFVQASSTGLGRDCARAACPALVICTMRPSLL